MHDFIKMGIYIKIRVPVFVYEKMILASKHVRPHTEQKERSGNFTSLNTPTSRKPFVNKFQDMSN